MATPAAAAIPHGATTLMVDDPLWEAVQGLNDPAAALKLLHDDGIDDLATLQAYTIDMLMAAGLKRGHAIRLIDVDRWSTRNSSSSRGGSYACRPLATVTGTDDHKLSGTGLSASSLGPVPFTSNIIDGKEYMHHPVMLEARTGPFPVEPTYLTEWNGLRIPAGFDCDIFYRTLANAHPKRDHWGHHRYFYEVPSRRYACWIHKANLESGIKIARAPQLIIDDEYHEQVAIFQSVLRAHNHLVVGELGGRWGTWGARAVAFAKARRPDLTYTLYEAEASEEHCSGMKEIMKLNGIEFNQLCTHHIHLQRSQFTKFDNCSVSKL